MGNKLETNNLYLNAFHLLIEYKDTLKIGI